MYYKAKNVDTDKALKHIEWSRKCQDESERLETAKTQKYYEGVRKGLDIVQEIFECQNFEKEEGPTYADGVLDFAQELGKELDVPTQDLRESFSSLDDLCAKLAERIGQIKQKEKVGEPCT